MKVRDVVRMLGSNQWRLVRQKGRTEGTMTRYAVVYATKSGNNQPGTYVPDLPGCITTGATLDETKHNIREAIELHVEAM